MYSCSGNQLTTWGATFPPEVCERFNGLKAYKKSSVLVAIKKQEASRIY